MISNSFTLYNISVFHSKCAVGASFSASFTPNASLARLSLRLSRQTQERTTIANWTTNARSTSIFPKLRLARDVSYHSAAHLEHQFHQPFALTVGEATRLATSLRILATPCWVCTGLRQYRVQGLHASIGATLAPRPLCRCTRPRTAFACQTANRAVRPPGRKTRGRQSKAHYICDKAR